MGSMLAITLGLYTLLYRHQTFIRDGLRSDGGSPLLAPRPEEPQQFPAVLVPGPSQILRLVQSHATPGGLHQPEGGAGGDAGGQDHVECELGGERHGLGLACALEPVEADRGSW